MHTSREQVLTSGRLGAPPLEFAVHMVRACIILEPVLTSADLFNTLEVLTKLARTSPQQGPALQLLVEQARRPKCAPSPEHTFNGTVAAW